jgi:hypothetical protein
VFLFEIELIQVYSKQRPQRSCRLYGCCGGFYIVTCAVKKGIFSEKSGVLPQNHTRWTRGELDS